jgi:hypothetical protein
MKTPLIARISETEQKKTRNLFMIFIPHLDLVFFQSWKSISTMKVFSAKIGINIAF